MSQEKLGNSSNQKGHFEYPLSIFSTHSHKKVVTESEFECKEIRTSIIRRVYVVILIRLFITFGFVCLFMLNPTIQLYFDRNPLSVGLGIIFSVALFGFIVFSKSSHRSNLTNVFLLGLYDTVEAGLLSFIGAVYVPRIIFMTVIVSIIILCALILLTYQSKFNITTFRQLSWTFVILIIIEIVIGLVFIRYELFKYIISCILATLYNVYVAYCTLELINEKEGRRPSANEFLLAALNI